MNIRNLFLVSMIVCTASVVSAAPTVSLAEQTENIVFEHMNKLYNLTPGIQKIGRMALLARKSSLERMVSEMRVGRSVSDVEKSLDEKEFTLSPSAFEAELTKHLGSLNSKEEELAALLVSMEIKYGYLVNEVVFPGKVVTKGHIGCAKRIMERTSKTFKAHDSVKNKKNVQVVNLDKQKQTILLNCMIELNKILRPEVRQLVKQVITLRKKLAEHELHQLRKNGVSFWRHFSKPDWYRQGRKEIEKLKEKLQLSKDEKNAMSALHYCKRQYIHIFVGQKSKKTDYLSEAIFDQETEIKNLAFVLQAL